MRAAKTILIAWLICGCHGPPVHEQGVDGGASGQGGGSGAGGTGAAGTGSAGTGTGAAGTGTGGVGPGAGGTGTGRGGTGGSAGSGGANACARCDTPCRNGLCDVAQLRAPSGSAVQFDSVGAALDGDRLYFVLGYGNEVRSIAKQGGAETVLYPNHDCTSCILTVAVDDADVFFAGDNVAGTPTILAVPKGGGAERTVCTTPSALPGQLTLEGPNVYYYRQDTGLERCPRAGGSSTPVATSSGIILRMASRPGGVVWANRDTGVVTRVDTGTLATRVLGVTMNTEPTFMPGVGDVVDDGTLAYWIFSSWPYVVYVEGAGSTPTELGRAFAGTGSSTTLQYASIGVDGGYVYFTEIGILNRVPKTGGSVEARAWVVDQNHDEIAARIIGFDERYAYLYRKGGGLYRVVK